MARVKLRAETRDATLHRPRYSDGASFRTSRMATVRSSDADDLSCYVSSLPPIHRPVNQIQRVYLVAAQAAWAAWALAIAARRRSASAFVAKGSLMRPLDFSRFAIRVSQTNQ